MKTTAQRLRVEIEYLQALARLYGESSDARARQATIEAIESLEVLLGIIEHPSKAEAEFFPSAA